ncbi:hypothetical protein B296_00042554, partial [Ensete ventricosum]
MASHRMLKKTWLSESIQLLGGAAEQGVILKTDITNVNLATKSSCPRTVGPSAWPTRRRWSTGCTEDARCRTADLAQVRLAPPTCKRTPHCQDGKHGERRDDMAEGAAA